jgi:phenylalanyl-tRNA synthetase alpha subunit
MNASPNQLHISQQMHQKHHQINKSMNLKQPPKPNSKLQGPSNNGNTLQFKQEHPSSGKTQTYPVQSEGWPIADSEVDSTGNPQTIKPYKQAPRFEGDL